MFNIITIGSATMDVFVESDDANIVSVCTKNKKSEFMSYPYGAKVEITDFDSQVGGGGVNTAVNFANLGFKTSVICKIGDDMTSNQPSRFFGIRGADNNSAVTAAIIQVAEVKSFREQVIAREQIDGGTSFRRELGIFLNLSQKIPCGLDASHGGLTSPWILIAAAELGWGYIKFKRCVTRDDHLSCSRCHEKPV